MMPIRWFIVHGGADQRETVIRAAIARWTAKRTSPANPVLSGCRFIPADKKTTPKSAFGEYPDRWSISFEF